MLQNNPPTYTTENTYLLLKAATAIKKSILIRSTSLLMLVFRVAKFIYLYNLYHKILQVLVKFKQVTKVCHNKNLNILKKIKKKFIFKKNYYLQFPGFFFYKKALLVLKALCVLYVQLSVTTSNHYPHIFVWHTFSSNYLLLLWIL